MNELIKLIPQTLDNETVNAVNARELHEFLEIRTSFKDWISRRIKDYDFEEGKDFCSFLSESSGGRPSKEYYVSLDMAKELAMVERSDKGKEARKYFIECEKQLKETLSSKDSLLLGIFKAEGDIAKAEAINRYEVGYVKPLEQFKAEAQPKVTYHDMVLKSEDLMNIPQIAKDFGLTAQKLNKILPCIGKSGRSVLHEEGIQYKDKSGVWLLYAKYLNNQYAQTVTHTYEVNGKTHTKLHLKWTQTGRLFIYELLKSKGILPAVEKEVK